MKITIFEMFKRLKSSPLRVQRGRLNSGFASCGVTVVNSRAVFQFNFSAGLTVLFPEIPHERKAAKR